MVMAGIAVYIDPGDDTDMVEDVNVTSLAITVASPTHPTDIKVTEVVVTSENIVSKNVNTTKGFDEDSLETWSSSMAVGHSTRDSGGVNRSRSEPAIFY